MLSRFCLSTSFEIHKHRENSYNIMELWLISGINGIFASEITNLATYVRYHVNTLHIYVDLPSREAVYNRYYLVITHCFQILRTGCETIWRQHLKERCLNTRRVDDYLYRRSISMFVGFYAFIIHFLAFTITQWDSKSAYCNYGSTSCLTMAKNSTLWISCTIDSIRVFPKITNNTKLAFLPTISFLLFPLLNVLVVIHKFGGKY